MKSESGSASPKTGLRERKKAKMRVAIQQHALRLFRERGYDRTTIEQVAEAAEISPATFFHYFPTKEDVVVYDVLDPIFIDALREQPPELGPLDAMRNAMRSALGRLGDGDLKELREREKLMRTVPELRARMLDDILRAVQSIMELIAERIGRPADDVGVRIFVGAVVGALTAVWFTATDPWEADSLERVDTVLSQLQTCLP